MDILSKYQQESERLRQELKRAGTLKNYMHSSELAESMRQIHNYLHTLAGELNFLEPAIHTNINLNNFGTLKNLRQSNYKLVCERNNRGDSITLSFILTNDQSLEREIEETEENECLIKDLKEQGLLVNYISQQPAIVSIQGYVPVSITFNTYFDRATIHLTISNFTHTDTEYYLLDKEHFTPKVFDVLGRFITRVDSDFMQDLQEDSQGISMAKPITPDNNISGMYTEEIDISGHTALKERERRLYLTYHSQMIDIGSQSDGIVLGRANDCEVIVNSDFASRHHAQLVFRKGKFVLVDQSTNGTFVKPQGGKEVYVQSESLPLAGSGFISLGKAVTADNDHLIYYSCQ